MIRNPHWYGQNATRSYPLDEACTLRSDNGDRLPSDLLVDAKIAWPAAYGNYAFVSGISKTAGAVTLVLQAADAAGSASSFAPLAVVTVRQPVQPGRPYAVAGQVPGVGGWVVFGDGATGNDFNGRFSTPAQSRLVARAASAYAALPVSSFEVAETAAKLTGVVTLKATPPLAIAKESRAIGGTVRDCIVVRLADTGIDAQPDAAAGTPATTVFQQFAGPCGGRPESNTCGFPEPVELVGNVPPDCDGQLTIEFKGCAAISRLDDGHGAVVSCAMSLADACITKRIPDSVGRLPDEYPIVAVSPPTPPPPPPVTPGTEVSESYVPSGGLPYVECFLRGEVQLTPQLGVWDVDPDDSETRICDPVSESLSAGLWRDRNASYQSATSATRNVATFDVDTSAVFRKVVCETKMLPSVDGSLRNSQLILNYREHQTLGGAFEYFAVGIDYESMTVQILRFNGTTLNVVASVTEPGLALDQWFRITVNITPVDPVGNTRISARVQSAGSGSVNASISVDTNMYSPSTGKFGVGNDRALSRFAYLTIDSFGA